MTQIAILNGDFEILFADDKDAANPTGPGLRTIRRASGASETIYTTNQLYSAVAEAADDFIAMGFRNPMLPVTPNAYTLENKYFIPRSSVEYLKEGAITANWALSASPDGDGNGVVKVAYTGGTNFVTSDIGKLVTQGDSGDTGTLLDFDLDPDGTTVAWIRPLDSTPVTGDIFDGTGALTVTSGTGSTTSSTAGVSGECVWSAIQAIGAVPAATEVYLYQDRIKLPDSTGGFQWWATDPDVSLGIISILVQIKNAGVLIADGDVEVFARRYTALYDNFRLNVAAGGFSALPLASAPDINNTTGYLSITLTGATADVWEVGNGVYTITGGGTDWSDAHAKGVVTNVIDGGTTTPTLEYYLVGDLTDFENADVLEEYLFDTGVDGDGDGSVNGAPSATDGGPTDTDAGEGGSVTLGFGGFDVDHDGNGTTEPYSIQFNCQGNVPVAKVYERIKYITRRGADNTDLFGAGVNVPGESYRGLDGVFEYDNTGGGGDITEGDDITASGDDWTARLLHLNTTNTPTYITTTDQQTSLDSVANDSVILDEDLNFGIYVELNAGIIDTFTSPKSSPFGTFTGSQIFGARGVNFTNFNVGDEQGYILTDDLGNLNNPPNTVSFTVTNTAQYDRILVARDTGTAGVIDKDQFGKLATPAASYNRLGDEEVRTNDGLDDEVPQDGYVRIVSSGLQEEHHYVYDSITRNTGSGPGIFSLRSIPSGDLNSASAPSTSGTALIIDNDATFQTDLVEVGMLVRNIFAGKTTHVWEVVSVDSETQITVDQLYGPLDATQDWDVGDGYEINRLIGTHTTPDDYTNTDEVYDLILDVEATSTSVFNTFTKTLAANFGVVVNVRQGKVILPFTLNQTQGDGSTTVTVVRQPDTIAT